MDDAPLHRIFDLSELTQSGSDIAIEASVAELPALAQWLEVAQVKSFKAAIGLRRLSQTRFSYEAELDAEIVQHCVVTLEPIESRIRRSVSRDLRYTDHVLHQSGVLSVSPGEEEGPEEIESLKYDLAAPLLEELSLSIDPYPRKEGAAFAVPSGVEDALESPFAALKNFKIKS